VTPSELAQALKEQARQHGFTLAGITTPQPPAHYETYQRWIEAGRHAGMAYLAEDRARERRGDPGLILPECQSILVLGIPYSNPAADLPLNEPDASHGRVAAYAWGQDYHSVLPGKLQALVYFLEEQVGHPIPNRYYTDTGPILERDLAQRAGLGWIGKNTCLISPGHGSYFLLAEILLCLPLPPDTPFTSDHCGSCTRCIDACPTHCILPDRTLDARRCISYLTIENKAEIPEELRQHTQNWVFGCDICQMICPWNRRFAHMDGDPAFAPRPGVPQPVLASELSLSAQEFNQKFKDSPVKRAKRRGYLRNVAIAAVNAGAVENLPALKNAREHDEPLVREHAEWAISQLEKR
jgi:epoxyqueuosine reductase